MAYYGVPTKSTGPMTPPETPMRSLRLYDDGFVKVRGSLPRAASASPRRVQAALKAKMAVRALERALLVARGSLHAATGTLRGAEVTTYTRLADPDAR